MNGQIYTAHSAKGCLEGFDDLAGEHSDAILRLWRHPAVLTLLNIFVMRRSSISSMEGL